MQAKPVDNAGQSRLLHQRCRFRPSHPHRIFERTFQQIADEEEHDEIQKQGCDDFVNAEAGFKENRPQQHQRAHEHGGYRRHRQDKGRPDGTGAKKHGDDCAGIELSLGADIPEFRTKRDSDGKARENQRCCAVERFKRGKF